MHAAGFGAGEGRYQAPACGGEGGGGFAGAPGALGGGGAVAQGGPLRIQAGERGGKVFPCAEQVFFGRFHFRLHGLDDRLQ